MRSAAFIALLVCSIAAGTGWAEEEITRSIRIVTDPVADICEVVESRISCLARSPADVRIKFRGADSAKRLHLIRVGYETRRILVRPGDSELRAALKARPISLKSSPDAPPDVAEIRSHVNDRLSALLFSPQPAEELRGFEFVGSVILGMTAPGKFEVIAPIMVEDQFRIKHLGPIERSVPAAERPTAVGRALWQTYVGPLAQALRNALSGERRIDSIVVAASYSRTRYVLVDDDSTFQFTTKAWVGSRTTGYGDVVQKIDEYRVSTFRLPTGYQALAATRKTYVAVFVVPTASDPVFERVGLLSNDNPKGELVAVPKR